MTRPKPVRKSAPKPAKPRGQDSCYASGLGAALQPRRARGGAARRPSSQPALDEFIARGFAATRLDDVAKRAGVAKGTIYLHFKDKEALFEELIRTAIVPLVGRLSAPPPSSADRCATLIEGFARTFIQEVATTRRGDIVRLIVAEGPRFPAIADFYYREVVSRGLAGMRALIELGIARGEIRQQELARFPQILVAPAIVAVIWQSLFEQALAAGRASRCFASISI